MAKMTKLTAGFGIFLGFCASVLPLSSHATSDIVVYDTAVSVEIEDYLQLTVVSSTGNSDIGVSYDDSTHTYSGTMANGSSVADFGTTVFSAATNNINGWTLAVSSSTKDSSNYATLIGANTGLAISSHTAALNTAQSSWNINVTPYADASAGIVNPTIASGFTSGAHIVPSASTAIASGAVGIVGGISVKYGVGISSTQAADTYSGAVEYTLSINSGS